MDELLTAANLQSLLKIKKATVYSWTRQGLIPHVRIANKIRYPRMAIEAWLERSLHLETDNGGIK